MRKAVWAKEIIRWSRLIFGNKHWVFEGKLAKRIFRREFHEFSLIFSSIHKLADFGPRMDTDQGIEDRREHAMNDTQVAIDDAAD